VSLLFTIQQLEPMFIGLRSRANVPPEKQKPSHLEKDGTVRRRLFLPSTVLTVSGSKGLWRST